MVLIQIIQTPATRLVNSVHMGVDDSLLVRGPEQGNSMRKRCEKKCGHQYSRLKNKTHFIDFTYLKEYSGEHVTHVGDESATRSKLN